MIKKISKTLLIALILCGVALATFNFFVPPLSAQRGGFVGTVTHISGAGENPDNPAWLEGEYYCVGTPLDCVVVY